MRQQSPLSPQEYQTLVEISNTHDLDGQLRAIDEAEALAEAELAEVWSDLAKTNYIDFYEFLSRHEMNTDGTTGFVASRHQRLLGDLLMEAEAGNLKRCMISMPPGHCKSTHCSHHFPAWAFGRNPRRRYLQAGHSQNFVENEMGQKVRGIIDSEDYQLVFPDVKLRADMKAKAYWGLTNRKGQYVGLGVGQGISGFRGDFGAVDDPYKSRQAAESQTIRDTVYNWYAADFTPRLLPWASLFIVSTRWHSDDVCGRIEAEEKKKDYDAAKAWAEENNIDLDEYLRERDRETEAEQAEELKALAKRIAEEKGEALFRWEIINLPALAEEDDVLGRAPGEPLWPELYDLSDLLRRKGSMGAANWNSLYQGMPMDAEGGTVSSSWFQRYEKLPDREKGEVRRVVLSVDAANTKKDRSDYTVLTVWFEDKNRNHYLADVYRQKLELPAMTQLITSVSRQWKVDAILVEAKGNGLAYIQNAKEHRAPAPVVSIEVGQQSKEFRFDKVSPMFEAGQVYLPTRAVWLPDYEKELIAFPAGKYDDQVDSTSQYLDWARRGARRGTKQLRGAGYA